MKVLVVGGGGREHALCWKLAQSPKCNKLYCAPGNAGIAQVAECVNLKADDVKGLVAFAKSEDIGLVVVGPEAPLVAGLVDQLQKVGIPAFGPTQAAAALEGDKAFMKDICERYDIPTAKFKTFDEPDAAKEYIHARGAPIVIKATGLAAGKGVILCRNVNEAFAAIDHIMTERAFGDAGDEVLIEEFLKGEEASFFVLTDGEHALPLASAQDHKAAHDGDEGPNTGGMGAYTPAPVMTPELEDQVMKTIIMPTIEAMKAEGTPYTGVLYAGLMIDENGPKLLEYNVRFGDPECQPLMMRLEGDLVEILLAAAQGKLDQVKVDWHDDAALVVVMAAEGYPGKYEKGSVINGLEEAQALDGVEVFHAGTKPKGDKVLADGGRVLGITAKAKTVKAAQKLAYQAVDKINWPEGFCRRDIGWRAVDR